MTGDAKFEVRAEAEFTRDHAADKLRAVREDMATGLKGA